MRKNDQHYLRTSQYRSGSNLNTRIYVHEHFSMQDQSWPQFVYDQLNVFPGMRLLALGEGTAAQWRENARLLPEGCSLTLTDLSEGMLIEGKAKLFQNPAFKFVGVDAQHLAFDARKFDRVTANHMLYHVPSPAMAIGESARVLKADGLFMAATNGPEHMIELDNILENCFPEQAGRFSTHSEFHLGNGQALVSEYFSEVWVVEHKSNLWVTEAQPLVDYAYSMMMEADLDRSAEETLSQVFQQMIDKDGGIFIRKQVGVFLARGPKA